MSDAQRLFDEMKVEMLPLEDRIRSHPFLSAVESGSVPRERFRLLAGEQYHIIESDLRSVAHLLSRHSASPAHDFFWGILQGEKAAFERLVRFGAAVGMDLEALSAHEPDPRAHAYTAYIAWLAAYGWAGQVAAAFALNFSAWGDNCARMSAGLKDRYGLTEEDVGFFDLFAAPPSDLENRAVEIVDRDLARGLSPRLIKRAVRLLQGYELMYWDAMSTPI
ncbi:MAG: transcriptional regulator [bacterium]|nr:transcriptional regulator [bacterium]